MSSAALTLGRSRGVALVGRPLDVSIPVALDSPGQAGELCAEADVFHGDTRVDASRVTARVEPAGGQNAVVRIRSSLVVDEPVVTVYLRLGCGQKFTRRYVLLAEEPGESTPLQPAVVPPLQPAVVPSPQAAVVPLAAPPAPRAPAAPAAPAARRAAPPVRQSDSPAAAPPSETSPPAASERAVARSRRARETVMTPRGTPAGKLESALPAAPARAQAGSRAAARAAVPRGGRSRLRVDMLDLAPERDPQLRSSSGLASAPSTDEQVRVQAAALWRSINAQPEDVLRDLQRVQALEDDVKGLRTLVAGNDRTLTELRAQLDQARQERSLTLAAIALLALLLAALVVTWWLRRGERAGSSNWWGRRDAGAEADAVAVDGPAPAGPIPPGTPPRASGMDLRVDESMFESLRKTQRVAVLPAVTAPTRPAAMPVPVPVAMPAPAPATVAGGAARAAGPASTFHSSFQPSYMASMRMAKAEELVDVQQQADFFMSLGQADQAIEVLESHIQHNAETSALVWLDLLAIYRALKRREDYELLRADFQRVFNAQVPAYDVTPTVSGGLEDYPRALTRIAALWPSPKVMDVIEESIFRQPGVDGGEPFDLEAYRELVMLYNLGREVVRPEGAQGEDDSVSEPLKSSFFETAMQPLSVARNDKPVAVPPPQDSVMDSAMDGDMDSVMHSALDSGPGATSLGEMADLDSMMMDSGGDDRTDPRTTGSEFHDPRVPRPSPRLGLDIDLTATPEPVRKPVADDNGIDFELFEPERDAESGKPGKPR